MGESALKSHILSKRHKEKTPSLSNIASLLTPHQDQYDQKVKDSTESASEEITSNEPAKKKTIFNGPTFQQQFQLNWVLN